MLAGKVIDPTFLSIRYEIDKADVDDDSWHDVRNLRRFNPNLGLSPTLPNMITDIGKAKVMPSERIAFLLKQANYSDASIGRWISSELYERCEVAFDWDDVKHLPCIVTVDMSVKADVTSMCYMFSEPRENDEPKLYCKWRHYLPTTAIAADQSGRYSEWVKEGYITEIAGDTIRQGRIIGISAELRHV